MLARLTTIEAVIVTGPADRDKVLTFVPMFHVNAWGVPFCSFMSGRRCTCRGVS
jgi:fatty-acyl-CoA synthase